jgi:NADH-quinone oxidoreductase subunit K
LILLPTLKIVLVCILGLIGIGLYGLLITRNLIKIVVVLQILGKGAVLAMVMAGKICGCINLGQSLAVTVILVDTVVAVIGLGFAVQVQKHCGTLDLKHLGTLQG